MNFDILTCRICNHKNNPESTRLLKSQCKFLDKEELIRYQCEKCGVIYGTEKILNMPHEELSNLYKKLYENYTEADSREIQEYNLKLAHTYLNNPESLVLNWGSGHLPVSKPFKDKFQLNAIDYDFVKFHDDMINDLELIKDHSLGGIVSNNLLEHLQDPIKSFKQMNTMLKNNGIMVHSTPCIIRINHPEVPHDHPEVPYDYTRFHTFFHTESSLNILAEKTGFQLLDIEYKFSEMAIVSFKKLK